MSEEEKEQEALERAVAGALRAAIHDHGPVTPERIGSAVKRIVGNLKNARLGSLAGAAMARRRWSETTAEERSEEASERSRARWASMTKAERSQEMSRRRRKGLKKR